jgi:glycosyltransferase involved in cell wall biosynthesis
LPSFAEGLPVVIMEAMSLRRPVISTYIGGIPELVRDGENGWLIAAGSLASLTAAMQDCLSRPAEAIERLGASAYERVIARHDVDVEAGKLVALFASAAGSAARTATAAGAAATGATAAGARDA